MPNWHPEWNPEDNMKGVAGSPLLDARWSWNPFPVDGAVIIIEGRSRHRVSHLWKRKQSFETRVVDQFFLRILTSPKKTWILDSYFSLCTRYFHPTISIATENLDLPSRWWYWWYITQWNGKNDNTGPSIAAAIALPKTHRGIASMKCWIPAFVIPNQKHTNLVGYFVSIAG